MVRLAAFLAAWMAISLVASVAQVADAADRISRGWGQPVFWTLLAIVAALLIAPVAIYFRLPKALIAPKEASGPAHERYVRDLKVQLAKNPVIGGMPLGSDEEVAAAIARLDQEANDVIRNTASAIFVSTAVMQNGRLDALVNCAGVWVEGPTDTMAGPLDSTKPRRPRSRVAAAAPGAARGPRNATPKKPPARATKRSKKPAGS